MYEEGDVSEAEAARLKYPCKTHALQTIQHAIRPSLINNLVAMIFLPATFVAIHFSMVFFHVGDECPVRLMVGHHIWLYPAVAVPLTVMRSSFGLKSVSLSYAG
jgi:hypothetical protein